jgi:hypothetical protein
MRSHTRLSVEPRTPERNCHDVNTEAASRANVATAGRGNVARQSRLARAGAADVDATE